MTRRSRAEIDDYVAPVATQDPIIEPASVQPQEISVKGNPYVKWIHLAHAVDSWRIFPRIFFMTYNILLYQVVQWFMSLDAPTFEQSGLVSVLVGAGAAWFGLYLSAAPKISKE
jgi:hypothetical protein